MHPQYRGGLGTRFQAQPVETDLLGQLEAQLFGAVGRIKEQLTPGGHPDGTQLPEVRSAGQAVLDDTHLVLPGQELLHVRKRSGGPFDPHTGPASRGGVLQFGEVVVVELLVGPDGGKVEVPCTEIVVLGQVQKAGDEGVDLGGSLCQQFEQPARVDAEEIQRKFRQEIGFQQCRHGGQVKARIAARQPGRTTAEVFGQGLHLVRPGCLLALLDFVEEGYGHARHTGQLRKGQALLLAQLTDFQTEK